ncbi:MAG: glycine zipper domain-containing protein [bacterium]|nr:glycine zipper domain-containing protein [bacterium]
MNIFGKIATSAVIITFVSGCAGTNMSSTEKGALGAGALGAGLGAIVGSQSGHAGAGTAIGAAAGLLGGGLMGSQIDRQNQGTMSQEERLRRQDEEIQRQRRELEELRRQQGSDSYGRTGSGGYDRYDNRGSGNGSGSKDPYY